MGCSAKSTKLLAFRLCADSCSCHRSSIIGVLMARYHSFISETRMNVPDRSPECHLYCLWTLPRQSSVFQCQEGRFDNSNLAKGVSRSSAFSRSDDDFTSLDQDMQSSIVPGQVERVSSLRSRTSDHSRRQREALREFPKNWKQEAKRAAVE